MTRPRRPRIVVTGTQERPDILAMFKETRDDAELVFLEYFFHWGTPSNRDRFAPYGQLRFWHEFKHADALLEELRPDKLVFFFITSLNQVALNAVAHERRVPALHLEHGFRMRYSDIVSAGWSPPKHLTRRFTRAKLTRELPYALRSHAFFFRSMVRVSPPRRRQLAAFAKDTYFGDPSEEMFKRHSDVRRADRYIAASPETFEFHRIQDRLGPSDEERATFIGFPQFDEFAGIATGEIDPRNVILIDSTNHKTLSYGWTPAYRREWVARIAEMIRERDMHLFVKEHPADDTRSWEEEVRRGTVTLVDRDELRALVAHTRMILGGYSTMQLPFVALPHTALVTLEIHPEPGHLPSRNVVEAGVARAVTTFDELRDALGNVERVFAEQAPYKDAFVRQFLFKLDGGAARRLRDVLVDG